MNTTSSSTDDVDQQIVTTLLRASAALAEAAALFASRSAAPTPPMAASDRLLRIHEVSELTGVPVNTLRSWRQSETGPQATRLGGRLVWDRAEVEAWVAERLSAGHSRARG